MKVWVIARRKQRVVRTECYEVGSSQEIKLRGVIEGKSGIGQGCVFGEKVNLIHQPKNCGSLLPEVVFQLTKLYRFFGCS